MPASFRWLFLGHEALLDTHRGWDAGALTLARQFAAGLQAPLFATTITRLLIDANRSIGNATLFSEFTRPLPRAARQEIVERYHRPHVEAVAGWVRERLQQRGRAVVHVAAHSFTPVLAGVERTADVGLLYDPGRAGEVAFASRWREALSRSRPDLRLRRNYPYLGRGDGLSRELRREHPADRYVGLELEVNQRFVHAGGRPWQALRAALLDSLREAALGFSPSAPMR